MVVYTVGLVGVTLLPGLLGLLGPLYLASAAALGAWFLHRGVRLVRERSDAAARAVFRTSLVYLALLYAAMLVDLLLR
jgi:protoheme IX farnesyltransferase